MCSNNCLLQWSRFVDHPWSLMKFIVWPVLYVTITYYDILSSEFLLLIITILLLHCYDIIITFYNIIH